MSRIGERTRQLLSTLNRLSTASSLVTCHSSLLTELSFVIRGVEMAFRFSNQPVVVDLPKFVTADLNFIPGPAWSGVGSGQCPVKRDRAVSRLELVERDDHVRKCCHERFGFLGDRRASNRRRTVVDADRSVLGKKRGDFSWIPAAPRLRVTLRELGQLVHIIGAGS